MLSFVRLSAHAHPRVYLCRWFTQPVWTSRG